MRWFYVPVVALVPTLGYLALLEALYRWYEYGLRESGIGMVVGGMLVAILSIPGDAIGGYEHTLYWVERLGYASQTSSDASRRYVENHVPIFATAGLIYVTAVLALLVISLVASFGRRHGGRA